MATENVGNAVYTAEVDTSKLAANLNAADRQIAATGAQTERAFGQTGTAAATKYGGVVGFVHNQFAALKGQLSAPEIGHGIMQGIGIGGGLAAFSLVQEGVGAVANAIKGFIDDATASQAVEAKLTTSLRDNVPGWQEQTAAINASAAAGIKLGFTNNQTADSLAQLVTHTHDVTEAVKLQAAAEDLARLKGLDLDTATKILGKVYDGNTSILTRYGIAVAKHATAEQALTAIEKAAGGQAEAYSQTIKGQQAVLDAEAESVREKIGNGVMPVMQAFMSFLAGPVMDALSGVIDFLGNLGNAFNDLHRFISPATTAEQDYEKAVTAAGLAAGLTDLAVKGLIATHKAEAEQEAILNTLKLTGVGYVDDQVTAALHLAGVTDQQIQAMNAAKAAADAQAAANSATGNSVLDLIKGQTDLLGVTGELTFVSQAWNVQQKAIADAAVAQGANDVRTLVNLQHIKDFADSITADFAAHSQVTLFHAAGDLLTAQATTIGQQVRDALTNAREWVKAGAGALQSLGDGMQSGAVNLLPKLKDLRDFIKNGLTPQDLAMQAIGQKYVDEVGTGMKSAVIGAKEKFQGVALQAIADISNTAASPGGAKATGAYITDLVASGMTGPEILARITGAGGTVTGDLKKALFDTTGYAAGGAAVVGAWGNGATDKMTAVTQQIQRIMAHIQAMMTGHSPAKEGPLSALTYDSGRRVFAQWVDGSVSAVSEGAARIRGQFGSISSGFNASLPSFGGSATTTGSGSATINLGGISVTVNGVATDNPAQLGHSLAGTILAELEHALLAARVMPLDLSGRTA